MPNTKRKFALLILFAGAVLVSCSGLVDQADSIVHTVTPPASFFSQVISDCNTGDLVTPNTLIQPGPGCDGWGTNRYERPFNAQSQDEYFPDLDILGAELGEANGWFYLRIILFDLREDKSYPQGTYAIEMDLDLDNRGDALVLAQAPSFPGEQGWSVAGVQVWEDTNQDVGNKKPTVPDHPYEGSGYDLLLFDQGQNGDPDVAWARVFNDTYVIVELAFKASLINHDEEFKWWVWADQSLVPESMDYHDAIEHEDAGDAYEDQQYFPTNEIHQVDNTCAAIWGEVQDPAILEDPSLCINDPHVPPPPPPLRTPPPNGGPSRTPTATDPNGQTATPTGTVETSTPSPTGTFITFTATPSEWSPSSTPTTTPRTPPPTITPSPTSTYVRPSRTPTNTPRVPPPTPTETPCLDPFGNPCLPTPTPRPTKCLPGAPCDE